MLKAKLEKIDDLPESVQEHYKQSDDGFVLDTDAGEESDKLKAKHGEAEKHRKSAEAKAKELQEQVESLTEERDSMLSGAVNKDDVEKLESSYKDKLSKLEKEKDQQLQEKDSALRLAKVDEIAAMKSAGESDYPHLYEPLIKPYMKVEIENGKAATRVIDDDGNPTADTVDDLVKRVSEDPKNAPIVRGSKASGAGAEGGKPNGNGKGNLGGGKDERLAAIQSKFPDLHG